MNVLLKENELEKISSRALDLHVVACGIWPKHDLLNYILVALQFSKGFTYPTDFRWSDYHQNINIIYFRLNSILFFYVYTFKWSGTTEKINQIEISRAIKMHITKQFWTIDFPFANSLFIQKKIVNNILNLSSFCANQWKTKKKLS